MSELSWKAWHANGEVFSSEEVAWEEVPREGIVIVTGTWRGTKFLESGHDAIYFDGEQKSRTGTPFVSTNLPHVLLQEAAEQLADEGLLKFGADMADEAYERLWSRAYEQGR